MTTSESMTVDVALTLANALANINAIDPSDKAVLSLAAEVRRLRDIKTITACEMCNGHGIVGGFMSDGSFDGMNCPECTKQYQEGRVMTNKVTQTAQELDLSEGKLGMVEPVVKDSLTTERCIDTETRKKVLELCDQIENNTHSWSLRFDAQVIKGMLGEQAKT